MIRLINMSLILLLLVLYYSINIVECFHTSAYSCIGHRSNLFFNGHGISGSDVIITFPNNVDGTINQGSILQVRVASDKLNTFNGLLLTVTNANDTLSAGSWSSSPVIKGVLPSSGLYYYLTSAAGGINCNKAIQEAVSHSDFLYASGAQTWYFHFGREYIGRFTIDATILGADQQNSYGHSSAVITVKPFTPPIAPNITTPNKPTGTKSNAFDTITVVFTRTPNATSYIITAQPLDSSLPTLVKTLAATAALSNQLIGNGGTTIAGTTTGRGLTGNTFYVVSVVGVIAGGIQSYPSNAVTVQTALTPPGTPIIRSIVASSNAVVITFTPATQAGEGVFHSYLFTIRINGTTPVWATNATFGSPFIMYNLNNNTAYSFRLQTRYLYINPPLLQSSATAAAANIAIRTLQRDAYNTPGVPTGISITVSFVTANITFIPPTNLGAPGAVLANCSAIATTDNGTMAAANFAFSSPIRLFNLRSFTTYNVQVFCTNSYMQNSALTSVRTFTTLAQPPTLPNIFIKSITSKSYSATLQLTRPTDIGSGTIASYSIMATDSDRNQITSICTNFAPNEECTINGLNPGTDYRFTVSIKNTAGLTSPYSRPTIFATLAAPPTSPIFVANNPVTISSNYIIVYFTPPVSTGSAGATIELYRAIATDPLGNKFTGISLTSPIKIPDLAPSTYYNITLLCTNSLGADSAPSPPIRAFTGAAADLPDPPSNIGVVAGPAELIVSFTPPTRTGKNGTMVESYLITAKALSTGNPTSVIQTSSPVIFAGLLPSTEYEVTVASINNLNYVSDASSITTIKSLASTTDDIPEGYFTVTFSTTGIRMSAKVENNRIYFIVKGIATGYVGLGFKYPPTQSEMNGFDYILCYFDSRGNAQVVDYYSYNNDQPEIDNQQNVVLESGSQKIGTGGIWYFSRPLYTGENVDIFFRNEPISVQAAFSENNCPDEPSTLCTALHDQNFDSDYTINFFDGSVTKERFDPWNAGALLCAEFSGVIGLWFIFRYGHKIEKLIVSKEIAKETNAIEFTSIQTTNGNATDNNNNNNMYNTNQPLSLSAQGNGNGYNNNQPGYSHRRSTLSAPAPATQELLQNQWAHQWIPLQTERGETYYYHERLNQTEWEIPPVPDWFAAETAAKRKKPPPIPSNLIKPAHTFNNNHVVNNNNNNNNAGKSAIQLSATARVQANKLFYAKKTNPCVSFIKSIMEYRIGYSQWSMFELFQVIAFVLCCVSCIFWINTDKWAIEQRFGYLGAAIALLIIIPSARNSIFSMIYGVPFERLIIFHRFLGRFLLVIVTVHMGLYIDRWEREGSDTLTKLFSDYPGKYGFISWFMLILINISSLGYFRRHHYNFFYYSHFCFIPMYAFAYIHCPDPTDINLFIYIAAGIWVFDRLLRFVWGFHISRSVSLTLKDSGVVQLRFKKHPIAKSLGLYKVGQYVFINFPTISCKSFFEWHPFTLTSSPNESTGEVNIRGLGDFTKQLQAYCANVNNSSKQLWLRIEGPYGNLRLDYGRYPSIILLGAGIGITPLIAILKDVYRFGDLPLEIKNRPNTNIIESIVLVWIVTSQQIFGWFANELNELFAFSEKNLDFPSLSVWIYVTRTDLPDNTLLPNYYASLPIENFKFGKPSFDEILDISLQYNKNKAHLVFACGPANMVNSVWDAANLQKRKGNRFDFHHETYDW